VLRTEPQEGLDHTAGITYRDEHRHYSMYLREREHSRKLERLLSRATTLLDMECDRREARGEDVAHIRAFVKEARDV
jgi:hypothetical protein